MLMSNKGRPAQIHYLSGTFRVLASGDHVVCAVTGRQIPWWIRRGQKSQP